MEQRHHPVRRLIDGSTGQRLRLASGLVLFGFVLTHYLNHAAGLVSLEATELARRWFLFVWRGWPGTVALYGALVLHMTLGLAKLAMRRDWRMPAWEAAQILFGLAIPPLLALHLLATRGLNEWFGVSDSYAFVLASLWPDSVARQTALLAVVWIHGCIGLNYWLRLRPWYRRTLPAWAAVATLVPVLAFLGFIAGGRAIALVTADAARFADLLQQARFPGQGALAWLATNEARLLWGFGGILAAIALWWAARAIVAGRGRRVRISYPNGRRVLTIPGTTVLEASRLAGVPHAAVCGGRGRCSTCRVRLGRGGERLDPPDDGEARVLARIGSPIGVRLACQIRPDHDLSVTPLLPPAADMRAADPGQRQRTGAEREMAVLFADLRDFTSISEARLPFDTVFLLNQYFRVMGEAIEAAGGRVDKFIGDGIMALFGLETDPATASRQALAAARGMIARLDALNVAFAQDLDRPLRMGIGLHAGPVIVGEMGYKRATSVTAIGDVVNVASRLESMSKDLKCQIVVSGDLVALAGIDLAGSPTQEVNVRGRREPMLVYAIQSPEQLPDA